MALGWTNIAAGNFQQSESFVAQLSNLRVNPGLLRTNTWAQIAALPTNITQWLAPDPVCQSTSPAVSNFVQLYLPSNYTASMTPYDAARALHGAVMRSLIYLEPPPYGDATNCLQAGLADCGGYASLLTAALRNAGVRAELYLGSGKFGAQMKYADRRGSPCAVIQGGDEKAKGEVQIKDLIVGAELATLSKERDDYLQKQAAAQFAVPEADLVAKVREVLARHGVKWG